MKAVAVILGAGAVTPLGLHALSTALAHRAGMAAMREAPLSDADGQPITMCFLPTLPASTTGGARALALGVRALDEAAATLGPAALAARRGGGGRRRRLIARQPDASSPPRSWPPASPRAPRALRGGHAAHRGPRRGRPGYALGEAARRWPPAPSTWSCSAACTPIRSGAHRRARRLTPPIHERQPDALIPARRRPSWSRPPRTRRHLRCRCAPRSSPPAPPRRRRARTTTPRPWPPPG